MATTPTRVDVAPEVLTWARNRSRRESDYFEKQFPQFPEWQAGTRMPTLAQLEKFSEATYTPLGYFFLPTPPKESLPLPDFRTVGHASVRAASPALLDTIAICEQRQQWYRNYAILNGEERVPLVDALNIDVTTEQAAATINLLLNLDLDERRNANDSADALRIMVLRAEETGILLMINSIVGSNTHRPLDPEEFRGFVLVDAYAPIVFINGADAKEAQIFTLCHELAHVSLGESGVSNPGPLGQERVETAAGRIEQWCDEVTAEMLIPRAALDADYDESMKLDAATRWLARRYKVSKLVVLRRLHDTNRLPTAEFRQAFAQEMKFVNDRLRTASRGGNFYGAQSNRVSRRFARALIQSATEGSTLFRDAYDLLGIKTDETFETLGQRLGVL